MRRNEEGNSEWWSRGRGGEGEKNEEEREGRRGRTAVSRSKEGGWTEGSSEGISRERKR